MQKPESVTIASIAPSAEELPRLVEAAARGELHAATRLRLAGPKGLTVLLAAYDASVEPERRSRLASAIDAVAKQKDAVASRLYWYTDIEEAKRAARASGKPILSLRLLGQLDDELSCANSRFFRTTLYPNREVGGLLREGFVLHWSTERPAPVVTIDFRDGRKIQRTVTGNSLHYVLDSEGRVVDAIPGLWGAQAFARVVGRAGDVARQSSRLPDDARAARLAKYHEDALAELRIAWRTETARSGLGVLAFPADSILAAAPSQPSAPPPAIVAMPVAPSKAVVEVPILKGTMRPPPSAELARFADAVPWERIAPSHANECRLDDASRALVRAKSPRSWTDAGMGRPLDDAELAELVRRFEASIAEDTVKNAYLHHAVLHGWLLDAARTRSGADLMAKINERIYSELFRTPASDPWLGLVPPAVFSGIQDDGITTR